jgi:hypothetical protein
VIFGEDHDADQDADAERTNAPSERFRLLRRGEHVDAAVDDVATLMGTSPATRTPPRRRRGRSKAAATAQENDVRREIAMRAAAFVSGA